MWQLIPPRWWKSVSILGLGWQRAVAACGRWHVEIPRAKCDAARGLARTMARAQCSGRLLGWECTTCYGCRPRWLKYVKSHIKYQNSKLVSTKHFGIKTGFQLVVDIAIGTHTSSRMRVPVAPALKELTKDQPPKKGMIQNPPKTAILIQKFCPPQILQWVLLGFFGLPEHHAMPCPCHALMDDAVQDIRIFSPDDAVFVDAQTMIALQVFQAALAERFRTGHGAPSTGLD